jgi:hypothetical protein
VWEIQNEERSSRMGKESQFRNLEEKNPENLILFRGAGAPWDFRLPAKPNMASFKD